MSNLNDWLIACVGRLREKYNYDFKIIGQHYDFPRAFRNRLSVEQAVDAAYETWTDWWLNEDKRNIKAAPRG